MPTMRREKDLASPTRIRKGELTSRSHSGGGRDEWPDSYPPVPEVDLSYFELIEVPGDWRMQALCRESDLDFFPNNLSPQVAAPLAAVCNQCPSQQQCLDFAIVNGEKYGLYGGLTPPERRALVKSGYVPVSVEVK